MGKKQAAQEQNGNCRGFSFFALGDGPKMVCSQVL